FDRPCAWHSRSQSASVACGRVSPSQHRCRAARACRSRKLIEPARLNSSIKARVAGLDWAKLTRDLDDAGYALTGTMLIPDECAALIALYPQRERFRSRVDMTRLRYGVGEYKYFARPLPKLVEQLRTALYGRLAPVANRWSKLLDGSATYPASLSAFLKSCAAQGQSRPTPLLLRYEAGGYNCLHQD